MPVKRAFLQYKSLKSFPARRRYASKYTLFQIQFQIFPAWKGGISVNNKQGMAVIPLGKGLRQAPLGKALLSHAHGSVPLLPVFVLQRCLGLLGSLPADAVRWSALLYRGDAEEEPQTAAGQSTDLSTG